MSESGKLKWSRILGVLMITAVFSCGDGDPTAPPGSQATKLAFTVQPAGGMAGTALAPAIRVTVQDDEGQRIADATTAITIALGANPGSGTLSGVKTVAAVEGVATFDDLSIDKAATGYTLTASAGSLEGATSTPFAIGAAAAAEVVFTTMPSNVAAGVAITPPVEVTLRDAFGNVATSANLAVTLALAPSPVSNPLGSSTGERGATGEANAGSGQSDLTLSSNLVAGTLNGTTTVTAVNGVARFDDVWVDEVGSGYTITASAGALTSQPSASFDVSPGAAQQLTFTTQPVEEVVGAPMTAIAVAITDAFGNVIVSSTAAVTVAIGTNPSGSVLSGTTTKDAVNGVATFDDLSIDQSGVGYTLDASSSGLTGAASDAFTVVNGRLVFKTQPTDATAGQVIAPNIEVEIVDNSGNLVSDATYAVTVSLEANPGAGTLLGSTTVNAVGGVATFNDLSIEKAASGYTLGAAGTDLSAATSAQFAINAAAASDLLYSVQPSAAAAGAVIAPAVEVRIVDQFQNLVSSATDEVTLAIGTNPGSGTLSGTMAKNAVGGIATFDDLTIDKTGSGYTLDASAGSLNGATSDAFDIIASAPTKLTFTLQPTDAAVGTAIAPAVTVEVQDALGNLISDATDAVTIDIGTNPAAGNLSGTTTVDAVGGVATFSDLSIDDIGNGYTLTVSATNLTGDESDAFNIVSGSPASLRIKTQPTDATAGAAIAPSVEVELLDALGNLVTNATDEVTMAIGTNPGGGTLSGTAAKNAVGGIATFDDLSIDKVGSGYTLTASSGSLTGDVSDPFDISADAASKLVFTVQPTNATAGVSIAPAVEVEIRDDFDNLIDTATDLVAIDIGTNPGGGTLSGSNSKNAVGGVATFDNLSIDKSGNGYTLTASSGTLAGDESGGFNISAAGASTLSFLVEPTSAEVNLAIDPAVQVEILDDFGNRVTTATDAVTMVIGANPSAGSLSGTNPQNAVNGVATFDDLSIDQPGSGYTLVASATSLTSDETAAFDVVFLWGSLGLGNLHSCALSEGGAPYCWGDNATGQLGDGSLIDANTPTAVSGGRRFVQVDAGEMHSCALDADGNAFCWGDNSAGQLGDGTTTNSSVPVAVIGGHTFSVISAANHGLHSCGVTTGGVAYCWGSNTFGQLGDGTTTNHNTPTEVSTGLSFDDVAAGREHTCAIDTGGAAHCWGRNSVGQLGNNSTTDSSTPVAVSGANVFMEIHAGRLHSCGLTTANAALCWGGNGDGQIGDATNVQKLVPTAPMGGHVFATTTVGANHTCGVTTANVAYCWGSNGDGRLGDGTTIAKNIPTLVSGAHLFSVIEGGQRHTCAINTAGDAWCWGSHSDGQVGDGSPVNMRLVPVQVSDPF